MSETAQQTDNMVTIEIDGTEMKAPKGSMIIEAADKVGIPIPRFCYHEKLSIAANCRMCLVDVEKAPKPLPACATPVMDGMKVYTRSKRAQSAQRNVMEFLLINHPLDCPICDQGGECELQDLSMAYGQSVSRFTERKRVVKDENLGSLISTEMTRCIHCTRCVRFLSEIAGTDELGGMGRGEDMKISTFIGRSVDSEMSGNIIDLCPVGALTDKPFRFTARAWEMRSRESVAPHDAVGSNLRYHLKRGRIMRAVPRENESINEAWLADRDRWGYTGLYSDDRATDPMIRDADGQWQSLPWEEALDRSAEILNSGDDDLGFLLSPRATNEELYLAQKIARGLGTNNIDHRLRQIDFSDQQAVGMRPQMTMPIQMLDRADGILLIGSNIRHDQPILGHRVRQAWKRGGRIAVLNPVNHGFHFEVAARAIVKPSELAGVLAGAVDAAGGKLPQGVEAHPAEGYGEAVSALLKEAQRGAILFGQYAANHPQCGLLRALARELAEVTGAAFCEIPVAANAAGGWNLGAIPHRGPAGGKLENPGLTIRGMVEQPRSVYFVYDFEPDADTAYGPRLREALEAARVVYCGAFVTDEIRAFADVILPLAVAPEVEGSLTNADGVMQVFEGAGTPPGDARAGWKVLRVLGNALGLEGFEYTRAEQVAQEFTEALSAPEGQAEEAATAPAPAFPDGEGFEIVAELPIYAVDGLVRRSEPLQKTVHGELPRIGLCPSDAQRIGSEPGQRVSVSVGDRTLDLELYIDPRLPEGTARLPLGVVAWDGTQSHCRVEGA